MLFNVNYSLSASLKVSSKESDDSEYEFFIDDSFEMIFDISGNIIYQIDDKEANKFLVEYPYVKTVGIDPTKFIKKTHLKLIRSDGSFFIIFLDSQSPMSITPSGFQVEIDLTNIYYKKSFKAIKQNAIEISLDSTGKAIKQLNSNISYTDISRNIVSIPNGIEIPYTIVIPAMYSTVVKKLTCSKNNILKCEHSKYNILKPYKNVDTNLKIAIKGSFILGLKKNLSEKNIESIFSDLQELEIKIVKLYPEINSINIQVKMPEDLLIKSKSTRPSDRIEYESFYIEKVINKLTSHRFIEFAAPDLVLNENTFIVSDLNHESIANLNSYIFLNRKTPPHKIISNITSERIDWGVINIEANKLWPLVGERKSNLGVIDFGFSKHEDISYVLPNTILPKTKSNHGNHVSSIACGSHNGKGFKGVVPNCKIIPVISDLPQQTVITKKLEQIGVENKFVKNNNKYNSITKTFTNVVDALTAIISDQENKIKVINISLGINIKDNKITKSGFVNKRIKLFVKNQAWLILKLFELAEKRNIVIYSSAGNDSTKKKHVLAENGSPINYASIHSATCDKSKTYDVECIKTVVGVVVQAHNVQEIKADFSNNNAMISCPGVNVYGAISFNENWKNSDNSYGMLNGTSMAAPYCAGGHILFSLMRPDLTNAGIIKCLLNSTSSNINKVPMMKLEQMLRTCK